MVLNGDEAVRELCKQLQLQFEPQDWGIVNASPQRLHEFIDFYENQQSLSAAQRFHMGELILASANEAALDGTLAPKTLDALIAFLQRHGKEVQLAFDYWRGLDNRSNEFPLASILAKQFKGST